MSLPIAIVWTTFGDEAQAREVVNQLVGESLVACGQVDGSPVHSIYQWDGELQTVAEYRVTLKLPADGVERLRSRLHQLHPYEVPEFVALEALASDSYARWVGESRP
jgi:periplasmic divalent cation tolerance protein